MLRPNRLLHHAHPVSSLALAVYGAAAMQPIRAYHLPRACAPRTRSLTANGIALEVACPEAAEWAGVALACRQARHRVRRRSVDDILVALQRAYHGWTDENSCQGRLAYEMLPSITGFSTEMIRHGLPKLLEPLRVDSIRALLAAELCNSKERAPIAPELLVHVLSGNIPGLAAIPMHLSLALQSAAIFKTAAGDPLFAALWAQAIAAVDPELGDCLAVTHWAGGDEAIERAVFHDADVVVASGADAAITAIAARVRGRFVGYGHKISFAAIGKECLHDNDSASSLARGLAYDVSLWDQQGCLSPQLCYVESGGQIEPEDFAMLLERWLDHYATELPPRQLTLDEKAAVARFRHEAEWAPETILRASRNSSAWSIAIERDSRFRPTCLNRCLRLKAVPSLEELGTALEGYRNHLEAVGLAVGQQRLTSLARTLGDAGVHRVCAIGNMQQPPLSWCQGGRPRVGDWVEWMQIEGRNDG